MARIPDEQTRMRITIETEDKPNPVLIFRAPDDDEWDAFDRERTELKMKRHGKMDAVIHYEKDAPFIDKHLVGVENVEIRENGAFVPLDPEKHPDWKERIPKRWKRQAAICFISSSADIREDEEKN